MSSDSPIATASDDVLGRKSFVHALAKTLGDFAGPDSFVVGIHGKWGTGKTSILNLVAEKIEQDNHARSADKKLSIMWFNPWNFSEQNQLVFQFLRQFHAHMKGGKREAEDIVDAIDKYAEVLAPPLQLIPKAGIAATAIRLGTKHLRKLFGSTADVNALFDQIATLSRKLERRTVIFIDDIDRLTAVEARQIFKLVKLTARFPFVIYVLAFDRQAVSRLLESEGVDSGEQYLEKIVQVPFDIPPIGDSKITTFVVSAINDLLATHKPATFDNARFNSLFRAGLRKNFRTMRDVRRFISAMELGFGIMAHELNGVDFIGIEAIRIFYPRTFDLIRDNKDLFAGHVDTFMEQAGADSYASDVKAVLKGTNDEESVRDQLIELFPKLAFAYGKTRVGHASETEWEKTYRIAAKRYFDAYFALTLSEADVSVAQISLFISHAADEKRLRSMLQGWTADGKIKNALESIRFRLDEISVDILPTVLAAFLGIGETVSQEEVLFALQISEYRCVRWAIFDVLDRVPQAERVAAVENTFRSSTALATMIDVTSVIERIKKEKPERYTEFQEQDLEEIKRIVINRIRDAATRPELLIADRALPKILGVWRHWGQTPTEPGQFLDIAIKDDADLVRFVTKFIYRNHESSGSEVKTIKRLGVAPLSEWQDIKGLTSRLEEVNVESLLESEREDLRVARSELQKFLEKGMTPEQFDKDPLLD